MPRLSRRCRRRLQGTSAPERVTGRNDVRVPLPFPCSCPVSILPQGSVPVPLGTKTGRSTAFLGNPKQCLVFGRLGTDRLKKFEHRELESRRSEKNARKKANDRQLKKEGRVRRAVIDQSRCGDFNPLLLAGQTGTSSLTTCAKPYQD